MIFLHAFKNGGGAPYEKFDRFHEVMAEDSGQSVHVQSRSAYSCLSCRGLGRTS